MVELIVILLNDAQSHTPGGRLSRLHASKCLKGESDALSMSSKILESVESLAGSAEHMHYEFLSCT